MKTKTTHITKTTETVKTPKIGFTWKRGVCAAIACLMLGLTACSAKTPATPNAAPGAAADGKTAAVQTLNNEDLAAAKPVDIRLDATPAQQTAKTDEAKTTTPEAPKPAETEAPAPETTEAVVETRKANQCGEDLFWNITEYGALEIKGSGPMFDYDDNENRAPWYEQRGEILKLNLSDELTSIGSYAFCDLTELKYGHAFSAEYGISKGITSIGRCAFRGCSNMELLVCAESVSSVAESAFDGCTALRELWIMNKDCELNAKIDGLTGLTVCGFPGSTAEQYAQENGRAFNAIEENRDAVVEMMKQEPGYAWEWEDQSCWFNHSMHYNGFVRVGEKFVSQVQRSEHYVAAEEEFQQARENGTMTLMGKEYAFTESEEQAKEWAGNYREWEAGEAVAWIYGDNRSELYRVYREEGGYTFQNMDYFVGDGYITTFKTVGWIMLDADSTADRNGELCTLKDFFWYGCYPSNGKVEQELRLDGEDNLVLLWASAGKK